jgi:hypothetical protein
MEITEKELIDKSMDRLMNIKKKMKIPEYFCEDDARTVFEDVSHEMRMHHISEEKDKRTEKILERKAIQQPLQQNGQKGKGEKEKMKMELRAKYHFSQKPGQATNTQLAFIQELRAKANEKQLEIDVDQESVPKMTFSQADQEIKRLKNELGWKDKKQEEKI